jgi:hypothetical protein
MTMIRKPLRIRVRIPLQGMVRLVQVEQDEPIGGDALPARTGRRPPGLR